MNKLSDKIVKHKWLILIIGLVLLIPAIIGYINTTINYDILVYLPEDIETMKGQELLTNDFNMGAFSVSVLENMNPKQILDYEDKVKQIDGVEKVITINDLIGTSIPIDILPSDLKDKVYKDNSTLLAITFKESTSNEKTLKAVEEIRKISNNAKIGGMSAMVLDTMNLSDKEVLIYVIIAVILCIIVLIICLDSYVVPFILLLNIGIAIIYNMGTNIFLGNISYITKAISAVLQLGVTTDFSIFLYHRYETLKKDKKKDEAMSLAIKDTFISVIGSSLTTIAGFLALCSMTLLLGKDIGIVMAKGVLLGVICVLTIFPSLLLIFDKWVEKTTHKNILPEFNHIKNFTLKHYKLILIIFILLLIPAYIGNKNVNTYFNLSESLPKDLPFNVANAKVKDKFKIGSPTAILIDKNIKNNTVNEMLNKIEDLDGVGFAIGYSKLSDLAIPESMLPEDVIKLFKSDKYQMILVNSEYEIATNELNDQITKITDIVKSYDQNSIVAGEGPLMKDLIKISDTDFHNVNYTSIAVIFIIMLFVLKSISLPIILVFAIEFAIFMNMSTFYYTGITLPFIASIVIGTIQLGATIDYAILMTTKYLEKRKTSNKYDSMKYSLDNSVKSIFTSGLCFFAATFGVGIYSKIDMIGAICHLIARGAIISMIVVILVLPSLLLVCDKLIIKTTKGFKKGGNIMNKKLNTALLIIGLLIPFSVNAAAKNETVYQIIDSNNNSTTTVTEVLENIEGDVIDESDLENILNINGEEQYFKDNNKLTWKSNGNSIYYQGNTNKKLPIDISIKYYLDDKEVNVKSLKGKAGHITIKINYKNNDKHGDLYTPFVVTMGTIIKSENVSHSSIDTGKIVSNGKENIVVGIATPGLSDSLGINALKDLNSLTIEYDTTSFEESDIYNVYSPNLLSSSDLKVFDKLDDLYKKIDTLSSSSKKLVDGAKKISNGMDEYTDKFVQYKDGVNKLNGGISKAYNSYSQINGGIQKITSVENLSQLETLASVLKTLPETLKKANTVINKVNTLFSDEQMQYLNLVSNNEKSICTTLKGLKNYRVSLDLSALSNPSLGLNDAQISAITNNITNGINAETNELKTTLTEVATKACTDNLILNGGTNQQTGAKVDGLLTTLISMKNEIATLQNSLTTFSNYDLNTISDVIMLLENGLKELSGYSSQFKSGLKEISTSTNTINNYTKDLYSATELLDDGTTELKNGIEKFNDEGIEKIVDYVNGDVKSLESKFKALQELGNNYDTFTMKNPKMNGETKFIVKIEAN